MQYPTILDTIGHTPLVKLQHIVPNPLATILAKIDISIPAAASKTDRPTFINNAE